MYVFPWLSGDLKSKSECPKIKKLVTAIFLLEGILGQLHLFPVLGYNFI